MRGSLDSETNKIENLLGHLGRVELSIPDLDVDEKRVRKTF